MVLDSGSGQEGDTGAYRKPYGPAGNSGVVYVVAGSSGWATFMYGHHPAMYAAELQMGSMVIDVSGKRLDAKFLRETGKIDDSFTLLKDAPPEPLRIAKFLPPDPTSQLNSGAVVRWKSVAGHFYRVEVSSSVPASSWTPASADILAYGATTSWTNTVADLSGQNFYRVVELLPR